MPSQPSTPLPAAGGMAGFQPGTGKASLRHRLADSGVDRMIWLAVPGFLFVVALFIYPALYGIALSFQPNEPTGFFGNYITFFGDPYLFDTIGNTFRIALPAALINVLAAIPLALVMRGKVRGKRTINTILIVPISLGTVLVAEGLLTYLGPQGWLNRTLMGIGLIDEPLRFVHNIWGVIISLIITGFPFAFLLTLSYITGINPKMEEAASTLGAGPWQRFARVTLPLLAPGLAITFCLTFVLAFSVFPSAVLLGNPAGDSHVLSVAAAQTAFQKYDFPLASTISVITAVVELIVVALVLWWRSRLYRGSSAGGKG